MRHDDQPSMRSYQALPLDGSPAGRLRDQVSRLLASGRAPRCPHGDDAMFWYLPAGIIACGPCADDLVSAAEDGPRACHSCGEPAAAVATWAAGGVACFADLCEPCGTSGLLPVLPN